MSSVGNVGESFNQEQQIVMSSHDTQTNFPQTMQCNKKIAFISPASPQQQRLLHNNQSRYSSVDIQNWVEWLPLVPLLTSWFGWALNWVLHATEAVNQFALGSKEGVLSLFSTQDNSPPSLYKLRHNNGNPPKPQCLVSLVSFKGLHHWEMTVWGASLFSCTTLSQNTKDSTTPKMNVPRREE